MTNDGFWSNRFNWCALAAGFIAAGEERIHDSLYVRDLAYRMFEEGAFKDRVPRGTSLPANCLEKRSNPAAEAND